MAGYGDDAEFQTWLTENGYSLPVGGPTPAVLRERGSNYIDATYGARFVGSPMDYDAREWPRYDATIFDEAIGESDIPKRVILASYHAALIEANSPGSLSVIVDPAKRVKRQKVDTVEREFFDPGSVSGSSFAIVSSTIDGLLAPLLVTEEGEIGLGIWAVG